MRLARRDCGVCASCAHLTRAAAIMWRRRFWRHTARCAGGGDVRSLAQPLCPAVRGTHAGFHAAPRGMRRLHGTGIGMVGRRRLALAHQMGLGVLPRHCNACPQCRAGRPHVAGASPDATRSREWPRCAARCPAQPYGCRTLPHILEITNGVPTHAQPTARELCKSSHTASITTPTIVGGAVVVVRATTPSAYHLLAVAWCRLCVCA